MNLNQEDNDFDNNYIDDNDDNDDDDDDYINDDDDDNDDENIYDEIDDNNKKTHNLSLIEMLLYYKNELSTLPDIKISTITATANISLINFNIENIGLYFNEFDDIIIGKLYNKHLITKDSITKVKIKKKNVKERVVKKGNFLNQISIIFDTSKLNNSEEELLTTNNKKKKINLKLFKNGSIQCTGLNIKIELFKKCVDILFDKLKKPKAILENNKFKHIYFCDQPMLLKSSNIKNFLIQMINTNFVCDYNINREYLAEELLENSISVYYDPNDSVSVKIKYKLKNDKVVSIMIFESGSISITGANSYYEIDESYKFINKFNFQKNKKILIKPIKTDIIINFLEEIEKEDNSILKSI